jgi:hypothetical protein
MSRQLPGGFRGRGEAESERVGMAIKRRSIGREDSLRCLLSERTVAPEVLIPGLLRAKTTLSLL